MNVPKFVICGAGAAVASLLTLGAAEAAMSTPAQVGVKAPIERVDCAVGFHIGPLGTCVIGVENAAPPPAAVVVDPPPAVVENPGPAGGVNPIRQKGKRQGRKRHPFAHELQLTRIGKNEGPPMAAGRFSCFTNNKARRRARVYIWTTKMRFDPFTRVETFAPFDAMG